MRRTLTALIALLLLSTPFVAADKPTAKAEPAKQAPAKKAPAGPEPTLANVPYGDDPKQVLDFYRASRRSRRRWCSTSTAAAGKPAARRPLGGVEPTCRAGISVVSIEYRFIQQAMPPTVKPPVKWPLGDAARALQFVRSKAAEWNIDKTRIGATGGSAGAC